MCKIIADKRNLEISDVSYCYEGETLPVWEHLSCCFSEGLIHAICGPSGCGKSSVLYLLDGLVPHMYEGELKGKVMFDGQDITDTLPRKRCEKIGFVMQNPESQFCTFTVEEELAFGMENLEIPGEIMKKRISEVLEYIGMSGYEAYDLNKLSGGQKQKIAIASVLVTKPDFLLLDEPTANLDPVSRRQIFDLLLRLSREKHTTIILVEHNVEEIIETVDHLIVFNKNGEKIADVQEEKVTETYNSLMKNQVVEGAISGKTAFGECVLKLQDVSFSYRNQKLFGRKLEESDYILRHLDLKIYDQEFLAITGKNGVGKTTLMRLIFQIFRQNEGEIYLYGKNVTEYRKKNLYHMIGLVFQNPEDQFVANTVWDEMMFSLKTSKVSSEEKKIKVQKMLERFHLEKEKEKSPFVLSQGQKRRLSVASMLLTDQKILFLDEPTYGQDYENRQELMKDMEKLRQEGVTIVMITHDMSLVKQYATREVRIADGRIESEVVLKGGEPECLRILNETPFCIAEIR